MKYDYNGHEYDGKFFQSKKFGQGTYTSYDDKRNEVTYKGSWKNDNFLGNTDSMWYVTENTDVYKGEWSGGFRKGEGEVTSLKGFLLYKGTFKKDNYNGQGKLYYPNGELKYDGSFDHGLRHGKGVLRNQDEKVYEGHFQHDKYHGQGKLYDPTNGNLVVHEGEWYEGSPAQKNASCVSQCACCSTTLPLYCCNGSNTPVKTVSLVT